MCCFRLHFSDFNVLFFEKNKKTAVYFFKKLLVVQKERKNNLSRGKIPAPPPPLDIKWSVPYRDESLFLSYCVNVNEGSIRTVYIGFGACREIDIKQLSNYVLLVCINTIYQDCYSCVIL